MTQPVLVTDVGRYQSCKMSRWTTVKRLTRAKTVRVNTIFGGATRPSPGSTSLYHVWQPPGQQFRRPVHPESRDYYSVLIKPLFRKFENETEGHRNAQRWTHSGSMRHPEMLNSFTEALLG